MKKFLVCFLATFLLVACNSDDRVFENFTYQSVYFPFQYPIRTLVLSDDVTTDTSIDRSKAFTIAVNVGGLYKNEIDRPIEIRYAPEILSGAGETLLTATGETLKLLPIQYYEASSLEKIVIPAGQFDGRIKIQLKDAFFEDPLAASLNYVLPLQIKQANEKILTGTPLLGVDKPRKAYRNDWDPADVPRDFTLFAVKFANKYHGEYFHIGRDVSDSNGTIEDFHYGSTKSMVRSLRTVLNTTSLSECTIDRLGGKNVGGSFGMKLKFNDDKTITISSVPGGVPVAGTGKYTDVKTGLVWGESAHRAIYLNYGFTDNAGGVHKTVDTLVFASPKIIFSEFEVK